MIGKQLNTISLSLEDKEKQNLMVVKRLFHEVWNQKNFDVINEIVSPSFISHYDYQTITGRDKWKETFVQMIIQAIPDLTVLVEESLPVGDSVVSRWTATGTQKGSLFSIPPTDKQIVLSGMSWTNLKELQLVENWNSWNMNFVTYNLATKIDHNSDILPICSFCKKIRKDNGQWINIDHFFREHSRVDFSHGICPICLEEQYADEL